MPRFADDMSKVEAFGGQLPEGWYQFRIDKVNAEAKSKEGNPVCQVNFKAQNEPFVGRVIAQKFSLQAHALGALKSLYAAVDYNPQGYHDPDEIVGRELFAKVSHEVYQGETRAKIAPWDMKSINEGPGGEMAQLKG
jgi:hypothetical protein